MADCPGCGSGMWETTIQGNAQIYYICHKCNSPFPRGSIVREKGGGGEATVIGYGYGRDYGPGPCHWVVVEWCDGTPGQGVNPSVFELVENTTDRRNESQRAGDALFCQCQNKDLVENFALDKKFYVCRKCRREAS